MARYDVVKFPWAGIFPRLCDPASHIFSSARNSLILEELAAQWCQSVRPTVMDLSKLNSQSPNFQDTYIVFGGPIIAMNRPYRTLGSCTENSANRPWYGMGIHHQPHRRCTIFARVRQV